MNWSDGANFYLLKCVSNYGKEWAIVSSALSVIASTFLKHERLKDFSEKSCSLQYKYLIASERETDGRYHYLKEENLLPVAISRYAALRREKIKRRQEYLTARIAAEKEDNKKLLAGRFAEISAESLLVYRKRLRAFGLQDIIAGRLGLEPLPPSSSPEEDSAIRRSLRYTDHADNGLCHATVEAGGGLWIPVESVEDLKGFFDEKNWRPVPIEGEEPEVEGEESEEESDDYERGEEAHEEGQHSTSILTPKEDEPATMPPSCSHVDIRTPPTTPATQRPSGSSVVSTSKRPATLNIREIGSATPAKRTSPGGVPLGTATRPTPVSSRRGSTKSELPTTPTTIRKPRQRLHIGVDCLSDQLMSPSGTPPTSQLAPRRRWRRGLISALATVCSHRHAHVFLHPVTDEIAPGYSDMIHCPVDLSSLRRRVEASLAPLTVSGGGLEVQLQNVVAQTAKELLRDLLLMFVNARMYNNREHSVHRMAGEMCADVLAELRPLWDLWAEDISGFPPLPGSPSALSSVSLMLRRRNQSTSATTPLPTASAILCPPGTPIGCLGGGISLDREDRRPSPSP